MLKTIKENVQEEVVEKKSKFIADLIYVQSTKEAEEELKKIKKKYHDARHHCYAYSVMTSNGIVNRASDDGEPSGTAGAPMLNIINKNELINVLIVVTRYFGGILLGTGGLVKAYSESTIKAIEAATLVSEQRGYEISLDVNYNDYEKLCYYCKNNNIKIINSDYGEKINCKLEVTKEENEKIIKEQEELKLNFAIENYKIIEEKNIRK